MLYNIIIDANRVVLKRTRAAGRVLVKYSAIIKLKKKNSPFHRNRVKCVIEH